MTVTLSFYIGTKEILSKFCVIGSMHALVRASVNVINLLFKICLEFFLLNVVSYWYLLFLSAISYS